MPSAFATQSDVCPFRRLEKAMRPPSRAIAGAPTIRASGALHTSEAVSPCSFQMLSPLALEDTYSKWPAPNRGEEPLPVSSGMRRAADMGARAPETGTRHSVPFGLASVATTRRPSALAASEVYLSMPKLARRDRRRSTSRLKIHGPDPSASLARYSSVLEPRKTGSLTRESWFVIRSGLPPVGLIRQTSMRSGTEPWTK